ncbi:hypothetical protein ABZ387_18800 [Streptomyces flaveolus]|uniref:hypothetical protein n=1 Tax=Streptomyces flaveolus TaxID=67297 RepID=UPI0033CDE110
MPSTTGALCPHCGWPDGAEPFQVLSAHPAAAGGTVWTRCACGSLQARVVDDHGTPVVSRGGPSPAPSGPAGR